MRKLKESFLRKGLFASMVACAFAFHASAQFNPPVSYEDTYVTSPNIGLTDHTSAYSWEHCNVMPYGQTNLVLAGWDHAMTMQPAGVSWRLLQPGNPSVIFAQGIIPYTNVRDLEVGYLNAAGDPEILVAYYDNGVGHKLDVYSLASGTPVWLYTNVLSAMPNYTRISIDCHLEYAVAIAWQDMGGINTVVGLNSTNPITFSGTLTLNGTGGETNVDLAFSHNNLLNVQYVYYNPGTGNFTESEYDFWTAIWLGTGVIFPTVNDINPVGICNGVAGGGGPKDQKPPHINVCPYPNIDCPGHYPLDNWAYTYTTNNSDISVRLVDLNLSPAAVTKVVNNGSLWPQMPTAGNTNIHPFCAYDQACTGHNIMVGWYTKATDPATGAAAGYIALEMDMSGIALISAPDYLTIANNPTQASPTPVLSMSKQDDMFQFLYTVFPEVDPAGGGFQMEHKYPPFCSASYKGGSETHTVQCNDAERLAALSSATATISSYPNPFANSFALAFPADYQQSNAAIVITDILGVTTGEYNGPANKANAYLATLGKELAPGTYLLSVNIEGKTKETLKIVKTQ